MAHSIRTLCQSVLLNPKELQALQEFKRITGKSTSTTIREALQEWIDRSPVPVRWPIQPGETRKVTVTTSFIN